MKVTHVKTRIISTPAGNPLVVGIPVGNATREFVTLELGTDAGVEGIGLTFFGGPLTVALRDAVEALGALVVGENPLQVEAIAAKLRQAASGSGPGGIFTLALSAIDIALWDIKGKALGQSVHALLGGYRDRAPTSCTASRPIVCEPLLGAPRSSVASGAGLEPGAPRRMPKHSCGDALGVRGWWLLTRI